MRKKIIVLFVCMQILCIASVFSQVTSTWDGSSRERDWYLDNPDATEYTITTAAQLAGLADLVQNYGVTFAGKTISIGDDPNNPITIDLDNYTWTPIGSSSIKFAGNVNGNNCVVKNFKTTGTYRGLFGYVKSESAEHSITISNINVESNVAGTQYVGGICGYVSSYSSSNANVTIENCTYTGNLTATPTSTLSTQDSYAGGIAGYAAYTVINNCATAGSVKGCNYVAGIAGNLSGKSYNSEANNCVNAALVEGNNYVGGIVGYLSSAKVNYSMNGGNVYGKAWTSGGIIGAYSSSGTLIKECLSSGTVEFGGAISGSNLSNATYCYYDKQRVGSAMYGRYGVGDDVPGYIGKTATELIAGTDLLGWTAEKWSYEAGRYPIPSALATATAQSIARLAAAPIFTDAADESQYYNTVSGNFELCDYASWSSSDAFISVSSTTATVSGTGTARLTATVDGRTKVVDVTNVSSDFHITNLADLEEFRDAINSTDNYKGYVSHTGFAGCEFVLDVDIDMSSIDNWEPIGTYNRPMCATFNGNNKKITSLKVVSSTLYSGLFGCVSATIKDLSVKGNVTGTTFVGGICGYVKSVTPSIWTEINNCHFDGEIRTTSTGSTNVYIGGICGYVKVARLENCSVNGSIQLPITVNYVGGIVGYMYGGSSTSTLAHVKNCINLADVRANSSVGGIVGYIDRYIDVENNLNEGHVESSSPNAGGIVGYCNNKGQTRILKNVNAGTVISGGSSIVGKLVASTPGVAVSNNYYDKRCSILGGKQGEDVDGEAEGKTTSELSALVIDGFTTSGTDLYPIPAGFLANASFDGKDNLINVAKASVLFGDTYVINVDTDDPGYVPGNLNISFMESGSVAWTKVNDDDGIFDTFGPSSASLNGTYGTADVRAYIGSYYKNVYVKAAGGSSVLTITSYEDLKDFRDAVNAGADGRYKGQANINGFSGIQFEVTAPIDMTDEEPWTPIGISVDYSFRGNFDGGNYPITNITVSKSSNYAGLFGRVETQNNAVTIKNINLSGSITNTQMYTAGIVGVAKGESTTVSLTLQNCHFNGTISSGRYAGGICAHLGNYSSIKDCTAAGAKLYSTSTRVGGICGYSAGFSASVRNEVSGCACIFNEISGNASTDEVGGIVGYATNTDVAYCINAALIEVANTAVGGVAGNLAAAANLTECLNFITVKGIGKIYGTISTGAVTDCYYDSQHCVRGTDNGTAKTTSQMKTLSLTAEKWNTEDVNMYPIPINISSHSAAIVAATPVTFAGSEDNQTVERSFTVYTPTGLVWTSDDDAAITIEDDDVNVTVNDAFSRIYLTATIGVYSKKVLLRNLNFVAQIPISTFAELKAFRTAVNAGNNGSYTYTPATPSEASPVTVYNVDGFSGVTFKLTADIKLDATDWTAIGSATKTFNGIFDGDGHAITKLRTSSSGHGLFGYIVGATIRNLTVTTYSDTYRVAGSSEVGGIVGKATRSTIENCKFNGYVNATNSYAGGIVGYAISSNIANCVTAGVISSLASYVGGICGYVGASADETVIENCVSSMDISGRSSVGGIAGYITSTTVQNCLFAGNVSGCSQYVGGIVGYIANGLSPITNNLNAGTAYNGGAIIGYMHPDNETNVNGNYYDNQHNDLEHGIAVLGEDGPTSDAGTEGSLTSNLIGDHTPDIFASGWTESEGMYPAPEGMAGAAVNVAVVPVILNSSGKYNRVTADFTFGSADDTGNEWSVVNSDGAYVTRTGTSATVDASAYSSATLTATYTDAAGIKWKRNVKVFNPDMSDPLIIESYDRFIEFRDAVNAGSTGTYKGVPNVSGFVGKSFKFADDLSTIDISASAWTPIGKSADYVFGGTFIGNGKTVAGLNIDAPTASYKGLFGYVQGGSISDLNVEGNVSGSSYVGGICGYIRGGNSANYSAITNCTFNGHVTAAAATSYAGGIVGYNHTYSVVKECMVAGTVTAAGNYAGGISGRSYGSSSAIDTISSCVNAAKVAGAYYVGGIVGQNYTYARTEYCNNGGNISGLNYTSGGIVGHNQSYSQVAYCLNTGLVNRSFLESSGDYGGAIIGIDDVPANTLYNYYDKLRTSVKGISSASAGSSDVAGKAEGLSTAELTGSIPSGLDLSIWRPAYWTFVDNYYPIPAVLEENDFTLATSTPIFIEPSVKWDAVTNGCNITLGGNPSITSWESSDDRYINVDDPENVTISQWYENNTALLTATVNGKVSKVFQYIDYGNVKDLFIETLEDLKNFRDAVNDAANGSYKGILNSNSHYAGYNIYFNPAGDELDMSSIDNWEPIGKNLANCFSGKFNPGDSEIKTIRGLKISSTSSYAGLFGYVKNGSIYRLNLEDVTISNTVSYTGAICGYIVGSSASKSVISNCSVAGGTIKSTTTSSYLGGIIGAMGNYTYISDCSNAADLTGRRCIGGICGYHVPDADRNNVDIITSCYNSGNINEGASVALYYYVGGIVGQMQSSGNVVACENTGNVTSGYGVGGIAGYFYGSNDYGRAGAISDCVNSGVITSTNTTQANAGGIVGSMGANAKVVRAINIGAVSGKKTNVGGIVGKSAATNFLHTNTISRSINGGKVSCADGNVGGICGIDTLTTITYNNNGGIVEGNNEATAGGIAGYNAASSELNYNLSTGTVLPSAVTNGLCGTNNGTVTGKNFYDRQRTLGDVDDESGKLTGKITGALMGSDFTEDWEDYFDFEAGRYPIPNAIGNLRSEAILAATPIYIDNATPEVYDSVTIAFSLGSADGWEATWDSELTEDSDVVTIDGTTVTVERKCEDIPVKLTATLEEFTKEYTVTVAKKMPDLPASLSEASYVWYGREADWDVPDNWRYYNGSAYAGFAAVPSTSSDNVLITELDCMVAPEIITDITLNNLILNKDMGLNIAEEHLLTITGNAKIDAAIKGNVKFMEDATCDEDALGYIEGTITKVGSSNFKFLTGNSEIRAAFKMTPASNATVTVKYGTDCHDGTGYPDWWEHGGNMGGGLNHVSDREYWYVQSDQNLNDVTLFWYIGDHGLETDSEIDKIQENMKVAYYNGSSWVNAGGSFPSGMDGFSTSFGYVTAEETIPFGGSRSGDGGKYITEGSTDGEKDGLVLPIELVSFTASCNGYSAEVKWATASEHNNDHFVVEKSYDAVNFTAIAQVAGAGNSIEQVNYSFIDGENFGSEMYYRLVQVDYDGNSTMSEIIAVKCADYELKPAVAVFPNPFRSELTLSLSNFGNKPATVEVFDMLGTLVTTMNIDATGNNYETVLNLGELSAATYTVRISTVDFVINKRIVKQ